MSSSDERAAFEEWAQENAYDLTPSEANERGYWYGSTAIAWAAWQARATPSRADGADVLVREIAALKRYDANAKKGWNREGPSKYTINLPVDLSERIDAFMEARATAPQAVTMTEEQRTALSAFADRIERAQEKPIPVSVAAAMLIRALLAGYPTPQAEK